jgi:hypothetical protein
MEVLGFKSELASRSTTIAFALLLIPAGLLPLAIRFRRRTAVRLLTVLTVLAATISITGCDGLYPKSTAPGVYTINVTATGASSHLAHNALITLTVTQ